TGAHLPGSLRPRLPTPALLAAREDRGQRREVPVDAEAVPADALLGGLARAHESHRDVVALGEPCEGLLERVELGLGPRTRGGACRLDADGARVALPGRPRDLVEVDVLLDRAVESDVQVTRRVGGGVV